MKIFIINGLPGSGKTTFGELVSKHLSDAGKKFIHTSSIEPIKQILRPKETWDPKVIDPTMWNTLVHLKQSCADESVDWDGTTKDQFWRKVMSDLKREITESMPDFLHEFVLKQISRLGEDTVGFVDIREAENIDSFKEYCHEHYPAAEIKTVLIKSDVYVENINNFSDNSVLNYNYDIEVYNKRPSGLVETESRQLLDKEALSFTNKILEAEMKAASENKG